MIIVGIFFFKLRIFRKIRFQILIIILNSIKHIFHIIRQLLFFG
ncbi:hypothetical protein EJN86_09205 [Riemerella anatipestifer]|nr:hypothetical protein [Riemerella anatipestifer]